VGAHRAQLGGMVLIACKTNVHKNSHIYPRIGSPREDMRWIAEIQRLLVELLNPPYVRPSRKCASTLSAPPQRRKPGNPGSPLLPIASYIPSNAKRHVFFRFAAGEFKKSSLGNNHAKVPKKFDRGTTSSRLQLPAPWPRPHGPASSHVHSRFSRRRPMQPLRSMSALLWAGTLSQTTIHRCMRPAYAAEGCAAAAGGPIFHYLTRIHRLPPQQRLVPRKLAQLVGRDADDLDPRGEHYIWPEHRA
jgi:hypothetical protein